MRSAPRYGTIFFVDSPPQSLYHRSHPYSGRIRTRVRANEAMRDDETTRTSAHVVVESPSRTQCSEPVVCVSYTSIRTHGTAVVRSRAFPRRRRAGTRRDATDAFERVTRRGASLDRRTIARGHPPTSQVRDDGRAFDSMARANASPMCEEAERNNRTARVVVYPRAREENGVAGGIRGGDTREGGRRRRRTRARTRGCERGGG